MAVDDIIAAATAKGIKSDWDPEKGKASLKQVRWAWWLGSWHLWDVQW